jgi:hypothetical protein
MAEIAVTRTEPAFEHTGFRLSWGAIIAGFFVALGLHLVLALLGIAIGMTAWDPTTPGGVRGDDVATGLGIWAAVSALIALFVGGATTGRLAGILRRDDGMLHGVVLWALTTVVMLWLVISGVGMVLGGAFQVAGAATGAAAQAVGPHALTAGVRGHEREQLVTQIAQQTNLTRAEADRIVGDAERAFEDVEQRAPQIARDVADTTGKAAWWALLGLGLSLVAAVVGTRITARE